MKKIFGGEYIVYENGTIEKTNKGKINFNELNGYAIFYCKGKMQYVHRVVAQAFIPNYDDLPCVNHKDGNKKNNNVSNLEWCTYSYNNKEAYRLGLKKGIKGKKTSKHKRVAALDKNGEIIFILNKMKNLDFIYKGNNSRNITRAIKNGTTCKGFYWKYID